MRDPTAEPSNRIRDPLVQRSVSELLSSPISDLDSQGAAKPGALSSRDPRPSNTTKLGLQSCAKIRSVQH